MTGKELYMIFTPKGARWTNWTRPVPFVAINTYNRKEDQYWIDKKIICINEYKDDTAIFIDLPGDDSLEYGMSIAKLGYRPIPLFNGTDEQKNSKATTDTYIIESSLINAGLILRDLKISLYANPVFMVDSSRLNCFRKGRNIFDNSWDLYGQDVPTGDYLMKYGIHKIILISNKINRDLKKIFIKYQIKGIDIYFSDGYKKPEKVVLKKTLKEKFEQDDL